jgi:hypothetical protein
VYIPGFQSRKIGEDVVHGISSGQAGKDGAKKVSAYFIPQRPSGRDGDGLSFWNSFHKKPSSVEI